MWCLGKGCFACVACSGPSCVTHEGIPSGLLRRACVFSSGNHAQHGGPPVCKLTSEAARLHSHPGPRMAQECLLCDAIHPASTALDCAHPGGPCLPWAVHGKRALFLQGPIARTLQHAVSLANEGCHPCRVRCDQTQCTQQARTAHSRLPNLTHTWPP